MHQMVQRYQATANIPFFPLVISGGHAQTLHEYLKSYVIGTEILGVHCKRLWRKDRLTKLLFPCLFIEDFFYETPFVIFMMEMEFEVDLDY